MLLHEHMKRCEEILGEDFRHVHEWLDEFSLTIGPGHRIYRHNLRGVEIVREKWGDKAALAAIQHLWDDGYIILDP